MSSFSWSYSAYSSAVTCLHKFKLCYVDKIQVEGPDSSDLIFGSALHSAINAVLTGQDGAATFELYWSSYQQKEVEYGRFNWEQLANLGSQFIRKFTQYHATKYELVFAEKRLYAQYRGVSLEGTPDFYGKYINKSSLRDFKTSGRNYESAKADCATQLYLYAYLIKENKIGEIETLGYHVFNKGTGSIQDLTWDFNEKEMYWHLDNLVEYVNTWKLESYPRNFNSCLDYNRKCNYFELCHTNQGECK